MFVALRIVTLPAERIGEAADIAAALGRHAAAVPGVRACWAAPVSPTAVINAGHVVLRLGFATEADALRAPGTAAWAAGIAPLLADAQIATVGYRITSGTVRASGPGIWRALVFRVMPHKPHALVRQLEEATLRMPRHVPAIRGWALSPVVFTEGPKAFTHVWEQEYDGLAGLTGPYMTDPIHWGHVDAYFDAEYPEYIVDPYLIQVVGNIDTTIITSGGAA